MVRRFSRVALGFQNRPQSKVRAGIEIIQTDRLAIGPLGIVAPPLAQGDISQRIESLVVGNTRRRSLELRFGFLQAAGGEIKLSQLVPCPYAQGRQGHGRF